jgi:HK97 family phage major capsid protein
MNHAQHAAPICDLTRLFISMSMAKGDPIMAAAIAERRWPSRATVQRAISKAAVDPGTTTDSSWAAPLTPISMEAGEFIALLRPATVLGRILGPRRVPLNCKVPRETAGAIVGWTAEGLPIMVSELSLDTVALGHAQIGGIVVVTDELTRLSDPAAEQVVQADLVAAVAQFHDHALLDPNAAAVPNVSPASLTYGAPSFASSGSDAASVEADFKLLVGSLNNNDIRFLSPYFIMLPRTALHLATLRTASGDRLFPNLSIRGGDIWGVPVLVTANLPIADESGDPSVVVLLDAAEILLAEGTLDLDMSRQASLQMRTDPQTGAQSLVSLWQNNLAGARCTRLVNWQQRNPNMSAVLTGVDY